MNMMHQANQDSIMTHGNFHLRSIHNDEAMSQNPVDSSHMESIRRSNIAMSSAVNESVMNSDSFNQQVNI